MTSPRETPLREPCPFCGEAPTFIESGWDGREETGPWVMCESSYACPLFKHDTELTRWNRRAAPVEVTGARESVSDEDVDNAGRAAIGRAFDNAAESIKEGIRNEMRRVLEDFASRRSPAGLPHGTEELRGAYIAGVTDCKAFHATIHAMPPESFVEHAFASWLNVTKEFPRAAAGAVSAPALSHNADVAAAPARRRRLPSGRTRQGRHERGSDGMSVAGYTENDRPIFAALDEKRCGDARIAGASMAAGMGAWSCLLRAGHTGGCWRSNPDWLPHYATAAERDAAVDDERRTEHSKRGGSE